GESVRRWPRIETAPLALNTYPVGDRCDKRTIGTQKDRTWVRTRVRLSLVAVCLVVTAAAMMTIPFVALSCRAEGVCTERVGPQGICAEGIGAQGVSAAAFGVLGGFQVTHFD